MPKDTASGNRTTWTDADEKHLLFLVIAQLNPQKIDWAAITEKFGKGLTATAASKKFNRIKARDTQVFEGKEDTAGTPDTAKAKASAKQADANVKLTSPSKRRHTGDISYAGMADSDDDEGEGEVELETPKPKKIKQEQEVVGFSLTDEDFIELFKDV